MYKRYNPVDYELYRLFQDDQRLDLEEQNDPAMNPEYASIVQRLAVNLNADFAANNAEMPDLNAAYKTKKNASAQIASSSFNAAYRRAMLAVEKHGPAIKQAHVIDDAASSDARLSIEEAKQKKRLERQMQRRDQMAETAADN